MEQHVLRLDGPAKDSLWAENTPPLSAGCSWGAGAMLLFSGVHDERLEGPCPSMKAGIAGMNMHSCLRQTVDLDPSPPPQDSALCQPAGSTMGLATSSALALPNSSSTRRSANSSDVPGPRLVTSLPDATTRSGTAS